MWDLPDVFKLQLPELPAELSGGIDKGYTGEELGVSNRFLRYHIRALFKIIYLMELQFIFR